MKRFARMVFLDGTTIVYPLEIDSLDDEDREMYYPVGSWSKPYPNTEKDSVVFGEMEALSQSSDYKCQAIYELGEPETFEIFEQ